MVLIPAVPAVEVNAEAANTAEDPDMQKDGWVTKKKKTFYYRDGKAVKGWQKIKKKWYFFSKETKELKTECITGDASGGYYYVGQDGIRCSDKTMQQAVKAVLNYSKKKDTPEERLYSCFRYLVKRYKYRSGGDKVSAKELPDFAKEYFITKQGNCYRGAAALAYCAKALGFDARIGIGGKKRKQIVHGWTEVKIKGKWYYYDVNRQRMNSWKQMYKVPVKVLPFGLVKNGGWELAAEKGKLFWK